MPAVAPGFFKGKHLLIVGAGYIGGTVASKATMLGAQVTALTRNAAKVSALASIGCDVVVEDLASDAWHSKLPRADLVLNCVSSGGGGLAGYRQSYVEGMRSLLAWAKKRGGTGTLVYTSSTSVYPQSGGAWVDETSPTGGAGDGPDLLVEAEQLLQGASPEIAGRWFILRLAGIYGPARHRLLDQVRAGEAKIPGVAEHRLNLIHRDDVVSAILTAFAAPAELQNQVFNVADGAPAQKAEVVEWLAHALGCAVPAFDGQTASARRLQLLDRKISNEKIKAVLGWWPTHGDFRAGYSAILEA